MNLTPLDPPSSNIHAEGFDPETCLLFVQFKDGDIPKPEAYEFDGVSPELYEELRTASVQGSSFGKLFARTIKPFPKKFPFRKVALPTAAPEVRSYSFEDVNGAVSHPEGDMEISVDPAFPGATDFTSTGPVPAIVAAAEILPPEDPEALKTAAMALNEKAKAIEINSATAYELAATTLLAITRMRDGLEKTFRPEIERAHKVHAAACAVLNYYDNPLKEDIKRLKAGMAKFHQEEEARAREKARLEQEEADKLAQQEADARAMELHLTDAIEADQRGEKELAAMIMNTKPLAMAPVYSPPVRVMSSVPRKVAGNTYVPNWVHEVTNLKMLPDQWKVADDKSLAALAKRLEGRAEVPGVRFWDAGNIRTSRKG